MCVRDGKIPDGGQAVDFIDCKCTGHNAEFAKNFIRKDKKVEIVGRLESGHYTEPGGRKIYTKTVRVYEINFAETKAEEETRRQTRENEQVPPPAPENSSFMDIPEGDGEFLFRYGRPEIQRFRFSRLPRWHIRIIRQVPGRNAPKVPCSH